MVSKLKISWEKVGLTNKKGFIFTNTKKMILKKTTVGNCGVWGAEGKRVRTFTNERHAKKKTGDHLTKKKKDSDFK